MRRVGKGFSGVETPLFEGMLVEQEVDEEGDTDENVKEVNAGDAAEGDDSAAHAEVPTVTKNNSFYLLHHLLHRHNHLKISLQHPRRVEHLEFDKVAQALEITKLKRRVKKLENRNKGRMIAEMNQDDVVVLEDDKKEDREVVDVVKDVEEAKVDESTQDQGRQAESQAEIYKIDMDHANKILSMQEDETEPDEVQEVVDVVTTTKLITKVVTTVVKPLLLLVQLSPLLSSSSCFYTYYCSCNSCCCS
uniref:Uncharacterized protein n=1 Tax=Tanacetum cinerariifolium TaxID=118510 RepID=A0A6L2KKA7_TANCI|nr:hypothetical protein [Tanacetum cinerariifolium]